MRSVAERSADWLAQAQRDLESAQAQRDGRFYEWTCFASQQAAEKACKAVLAKRGAEGHSVLKLLAGIGVQSGDLLAAARMLDSFYVPARYPNGWAEGAPKDLFGKEEADRAIAGAKTIIGHCADLLA